MNRYHIETSAQQIKSRTRRRDNRFSDERSNLIGGKYDPLIGCIQESFGISADEAERLLENSVRR